MFSECTENFDRVKKNSVSLMSMPLWHFKRIDKCDSRMNSYANDLKTILKLILICDSIAFALAFCLLNFDKFHTVYFSISIPFFSLLFSSSTKHKSLYSFARKYRNKRMKCIWLTACLSLVKSWNVNFATKCTMYIVHAFIGVCLSGEWVCV